MSVGYDEVITVNPLGGAWTESPLFTPGELYSHLSPQFVAESSVERWPDITATQISEIYTELREDFLKWVSEFRVPQAGPIDVVATAYNAGIFLKMDNSRGAADRAVLLRRPDGFREVHMGGRFTQDSEQRRAFGHELAHLYDILARGDSAKPVDESSALETICDWLSYDLALPPRVVEEVETLDSQTFWAIFKNWGVDAKEVIVQGMKLDRLPPVLALREYWDTCRVVCKNCLLYPRISEPCASTIPPLAALNINDLKDVDCLTQSLEAAACKSTTSDRFIVHDIEKTGTTWGDL